MIEHEALEKMAEDIRLLNPSENTLRNYTRNVRNFLAFCQRPLEELDETDVRRYIRHLLETKVMTPKSINQCSAVQCSNPLFLCFHSESHHKLSSDVADESSQGTA